MARLTRRAVGDFARRPVGAAFETCITQTSATTFGDHLTLPILGQVTDQFIRIDIVHDCSLRHFDFEVVPGLTGHVAPATAGAAFSLEFAGYAKVRECIER